MCAVQPPLCWIDGRCIIVGSLLLSMYPSLYGRTLVMVVFVVVLLLNRD